jgi:oxalate decarboxylase
MTAVFTEEAKARTFDFQAGDVSYVPMSMSQFIESARTTTLSFPESLKSAHFMDVLLAQSMAMGATRVGASSFEPG